MDQLRHPKLYARVHRVHGVIRGLARYRPIPVEPTSPEAVGQLCGMLRRASLRKPLLKPGGSWLRSVIVADPFAFATVAERVELVMDWQGQQWRWKPWGMLVQPLTGLSPEAVEAIVSRLRPCLLSVHLGRDPRPFAGLLDGLPAVVRS